MLDENCLSALVRGCAKQSEELKGLYALTRTAQRRSFVLASRVRAVPLLEHGLVEGVEMRVGLA